MDVTKEEVAFAVAEVHAVTLAIAEEGAIVAIACSHPLAIAIGLETMFPHVHEVVVVDVALVVVATDAGAGGDGAVDQDGTNGDACLTGVEVVAHFAFVIAQKSFTTVFKMDMPFLAGGTDELEDGAELCIGQLQLGVGSCTTYWEDGEDAPAGHSLAKEVLTDVGQMVEDATGDASDDIVGEMGDASEHGECLIDPLETLRIATHPIVVVLQAVEAEGDGMHAGLDQTHKTFGGKGKAVGDHSPWESFGIDGGTAVFEVGSHERFASRDDDEDIVWIGLGGDAVEHSQEVVLGHVGLSGLSLTVASAMAAMEVAAEGTLPKQLLQGMFLQHVLFAFAP